jgi:DNA-binding XRE family transcriptional regulator
MFYVGRGTGRRMNRHFSESSLQYNVNPHKSSTIKKCKQNGWKCYGKKLATDLTLEEAKELEQLILDDDCIFDQLTNIIRTAYGGQTSYGSDSPLSLLDEESVAEIKWLVENTECAQKQLAIKYEVSTQAICDIINERNWIRVEPSKPESIPKPNKLGMTKKQVAEAKWLVKNTDASQKDIGDLYDVTSYTISCIKTGKRYTDVKPCKPQEVSLDSKKTYKLSGEEVSEIKWLLNNTKFTQKSVAKHYDVKSQTISEINVGKIHEDVKSCKPQPIPDLKKPKKPALSKKEAGEIKYLLEESDMTQSEIGERFGVSRKTVSSINCGYTYQDVPAISTDICN